MRVHHARRHLDELAGVTNHQNALKALGRAGVQGLAQVVGKLHALKAIKLGQGLGKTGAVVTRHQHKVSKTQRRLLANLELDRVDQRGDRARPHDAGRAQNGNAALDAQVRVEGLGTNAGTFGSINRHRQCAGLASLSTGLLDLLGNHLPRGRVDGGGAHRLVKARLGYAANALAAVDEDSSGGGVRTFYLGVYEKAVGRVNVVSAVLANGRHGTCAAIEHGGL